VSQSMLQRRLQFRTLGMLELIPSLVGVPVTIGLALSGVGAASIVVGVLAGSAAQTLACLWAVRPPRPRWIPSSARGLLAFGTPAALASVIYTGGRQAQYMILGAGLGAHQLGVFWRAYQLGTEYQGKVSGIMLRLALPLYSRTSGPDEMKRIRGRIVRVHAALLLPFLGLLIITSPELIPILYGEAWTQAVGPTQILAVGGMAGVINTGVGALLVAAGHPKTLLLTNVTLIGVLLAGIAATLQFGLTAVCLSVTASQVIGFLYVHLWVLPRTLDLPSSHLIDDVGPALTCSVVMLVVGTGSAAVLRHSGAPVGVVLVAASMVAGAAYMLTLRRLFRPAWADMLMLVNRSAAPLRRRRLRSLART
jgi:O-antigen/teichoic acid export membrane protein